MKLDQQFNGMRFFNLLRLESSFGYRNVLLAGIGVFAILTIVALSTAQDHDFRDFHNVWYAIVLLGGGFVFTSIIANGLNNPQSRMSHLSLPASDFEKFLSKLLISSLGYLIVVTLVYWLFAGITDSLISRWFNYQRLPFNPFNAFYLLIIKLYLVLQSIFLLGALYFRRFEVFKTLVSLLAIAIVFGIIGFILVRIFFYDAFEGLFETSNHTIPYIPSEGFRDFVSGSLWSTVQNLFWFALAPLFWIVGYFKMKETEV